MTRLPHVVEVFAVASLLSFGGTNAILPHLRRELVIDAAWVTDAGFTQAYAVAQLIPGPSSTVVTLLGYQAAGATGAAIATVAMLLPSCALMFVFSRLWQRTGTAAWHRTLENGLAPLGVGLIASAGIVLARAADHDLPAWLVTTAACAVLATTEVRPLFVIAMGGVAGLFAP